METKKVLTRDNIPTEELSDTVSIYYKGIRLEYTEVYYLDYAVDEDTGIVNRGVKEKHYTRSQMDGNLKALKNAYSIATG